MTDVTDKTEDQTNDAQKQQNEKILAECKTLTRQGFNKDQIAQQLSSKFQKTGAEIAAIIEQNKDKEDDK